jgi:acetyltransferase
MDSSLRKFFKPDSLVLLGASSKEGSIGYEVLKSILKFEFLGKIFVLNPNAKEILGIPCNSTLEEISDKIDLAIILLPKRLVLRGFQQCVRKGINNVIVVTAGFKEVGGDGAALERELVRIATDNQIRLVGPNCMGVINTADSIKLNATFAADLPKHSSTAFLSQSGALAAAILNTISQTGFSFGQFISVGNKADVNENDLLEYWAGDQDVDIIAMYLESFENGRKFFELAKQVTPNKPVIILKAARSDLGMKAALSHTGALAAQDALVNAMMNQCGIIRVENIEEMFATAEALQKFSLPKGNRIAVITNAGGPAILCVDECDKNQLKLSDLSNETIEKLKQILIPEANFNNPIDMLPGATAEVYKRVTEIVLADENVDTAIVIFVEPVMIDSFEVISALSSVQKKSTKPILISCFPLPIFWERWKREGDSDSVIYKSTEFSPKIIRNLYHRRIYLNSQKTLQYLEEQKLDAIKIESIKKIIQESNGRFLTQKGIRKICSIAKLPFVHSITIKNFTEAKKSLNKISLPLVLKIESDEITHKSDVGGVIIGIQSKKELAKAFKESELRLKKKKLFEKITGYTLQEFITDGTEVIIGGFRDESFGPVIMFGAGGKLVELIKDTNFALAPLNKEEAFSLIQRSKIYSMLIGYRGEKRIDVEFLAGIIQICSELIFIVDEIKEFDINPLILNPKRNKSKIVDMRIVVQSENDFIYNRGGLV